MTVAIGFNCSDAILLSAETEVTTPGISKLDSSKIFTREYTNGIRSGIAAAGGMAYARMAMQHIEQRLDEIKKQKATIGKMRAEIETEVLSLYKSHIVPHPDSAAVAFYLLIALWSPVNKRAALLWTEDSAVNELRGYCPIGAGDYLAHYLVRSKYSPSMKLSDVRTIAIGAIAEAKRFVPGCGGFTELLSLSRKGVLGEVERLPAS